MFFQKKLDRSADICFIDVDYKHISRRYLMAHIFLSQLKTVLNNCIDELEQIHFLFSRNPETDFTRKRKLTFKEYIQFMLLMQGKTVSNEILDFFSHPCPHRQNQHSHSSVTSFFLNDGISCSIPL